MTLPPWLLGGLLGGGAVLLVGLLQRQRMCPDCGTPLPKFRKPQTRKQTMWGGWTCPKCGIDIDRSGNKRS